MSKLTIRYTSDNYECEDCGPLTYDRMIITDEFGVTWFDDGGDDHLNGDLLSNLMPYELAYKILQGLGYEVEIV